MDCCDSEFLVMSPWGRHPDHIDFVSKRVVARFPSDAAEIACQFNERMSQRRYGDTDNVWEVYSHDARVRVLVVLVGEP